MVAISPRQAGQLQRPRHVSRPARPGVHRRGYRSGARAISAVRVRAEDAGHHPFDGLHDREREGPAEGEGDLYLDDGESRAAPGLRWSPRQVLQAPRALLLRTVVPDPSGLSERGRRCRHLRCHRAPGYVHGQRSASGQGARQPGWIPQPLHLQALGWSSATVQHQHRSLHHRLGHGQVREWRRGSGADYADSDSGCCPGKLGADPGRHPEYDRDVPRFLRRVRPCDAPRQVLRRRLVGGVLHFRHHQAGRTEAAHLDHRSGGGSQLSYLHADPGWALRGGGAGIRVRPASHLRLEAGPRRTGEDDLSADRRLDVRLAEPAPQSRGPLAVRIRIGL